MYTSRFSIRNRTTASFLTKRTSRGNFSFHWIFTKPDSLIVPPESQKVPKRSARLCTTIWERETIQTLAKMGVKLIAMRCAGLNNVAVETVHELGLELTNVRILALRRCGIHAGTPSDAQSANPPRIQ